MAQITEAPTGRPGADAPFAFRPLDLAGDVPRLTRLHNEIEAVEHLGETVTETEMRGRLTWPGTDPARDRRVLADPADPDRLIAAANVNKGGDTAHFWLNILVHPDRQRHGIGGALLAWGLGRAREQGAAYVTSGAHSRQPGRHAFLRKHGFVPGAIWIFMRAPAETVLPEPQVPPGFRIVPYATIDDVDVLATALNRGFIGHYHHRDLTRAEFEHWLQKPGLRRDGIFIALGPDGAPAGICWTDTSPELSARRGTPTGYIDDLGVVPEHRRRGLGRALLLTGMHWLRGQGLPTIELDAWGHNDLAVPLYEATGFAVTEQGTEYRYDFPESTGAVIAQE